MPPGARSGAVVRDGRNALAGSPRIGNTRRVKSDPPEARTGIAPLAGAETPLQRATRELREQAAAAELETARESERLNAELHKAANGAQPSRRVQLVLDLHYDYHGTLIVVDGVCNGKRVLHAQDTANGVDLGAAAVRTLELGALGALLGP